MCGLVAILDRETTIQKTNTLQAMFKELLVITSLRGVDSTGVCTVGADGYRILKKAIPSPDFVDLIGYKDLFKSTTTAMMGHCRASTVGRSTAENAHPHYRDEGGCEIALMHNGTLTGHALLTKKDYAVDSDAIAIKLSEASTASDTILALESFTGAYALIWSNFSDSTLNVARNTERPLSIGIVKDSGSIIFASEMLSISWIAHRHQLELESLKSVETGMWLTYCLKTGNLLYSRPFVPKVINTYLDSTYNRNLGWKAPGGLVSQYPANITKLTPSTEVLKVTMWSKALIPMIGEDNTGKQYLISQCAYTDAKFLMCEIPNSNSEVMIKGDRFKRSISVRIAVSWEITRYYKELQVNSSQLVYGTNQ